MGGGPDSRCVGRVYSADGAVHHFFSAALIFWKLIYFLVHRIPVFQLQVKVKVKFSLEQATKAQKGSRGTALLVL